ncbi:cytochrome-c peroxidase [Acidocella aromatica]|uniref:Cytochrome c peroxidase n=1 Tax=Acidocella aromatica TaxID=1303579 RepID=A0A840V8Y5_9PROT|nr:cytochrome c peroxidase [Acidocella aromatica]MBB5372206.1 cytochrome c peroxidase [Acidocella aromatica]
MRILTVAMALGVCAAVAAILSTPVPVAAWLSNPAASFKLARGENPNPVQLVRPESQPLSAMALLGEQIFFDKSLSSSGKLACASCHDPSKAYGPPSDLPAVYGGPELKNQGARAVPSLMYLITQPNFSIGPDPAGDADNPTPLPQLAAAASAKMRAIKTAQSTAQSAANIVPAGGLFWDGRVNTLQTQAMGPLFSPFEMDAGDITTVTEKLQAAPYASQFTTLFGSMVFLQPRLLVAEAMFAVARYQVENQDFHPYTSKYDYWLEGKARFTRAELRGYVLFNDVNKGDCAACHLDQPDALHNPPLFTDHQYEALGVPRNPDLADNKDASYYDMGICGPYRTDLAQQTQYCGMFLTPTLRNAATRQVFFHNGEYHTLKQVLDFYNLRDVQPGKIYPRGPDGAVQKFNDLPAKYQANIDNTDPPLNRTLGQQPALSEREEQDIIAYMKTLTDGYTPPGGKPGA